MKQLFIIIMLIGFLTILASGCSQSKKVFTTAEFQTQERFEMDKAVCNSKAKTAAYDKGYPYHIQIEIWIKVFEGCLEEKNYVLDKEG